MKLRTIYKENTNNHVRLPPVFFPMGRGSGFLWGFWLFVFLVLFFLFVCFLLKRCTSCFLGIKNIYIFFKDLVLIVNGIFFPSMSKFGKIIDRPCCFQIKKKIMCSPPQFEDHRPTWNHFTWDSLLNQVGFPFHWFLEEACRLSPENPKIPEALS